MKAMEDQVFLSIYVGIWNLEDVVSVCFLRSSIGDPWLASSFCAIKLQIGLMLFW